MIRAAGAAADTQEGIAMTTPRTKSAPPMRPKKRAARVAAHPDVGSVPPARRVDEALDLPFAEGIADQLDPDLRHRLISEVAFHRHAERGFSDDYDDEDWRDAEADVDHVAVERPADAT
ncbi:hypothetical protein RHIZO_04001 [Rhizobiaceae bacterium]|nr:hypothetical protein RHIZO_04001 [Rhizobiaceae bacterium]